MENAAQATASTMSALVVQPAPAATERSDYMTKVAFVCVHNSCRSQIAEALGKNFAADAFESFSAGTELKDRINSDAVRLMKQLYGIDMEQTQRPKSVADIPPVEVVVTMGCNVECPYLPCKHREDWGLDDPTGKPDEEFVKVIKTIEDKIRELSSLITAWEDD